MKIPIFWLGTIAGSGAFTDSVATDGGGCRGGGGLAVRGTAASGGGDPPLLGIHPGPPQVPYPRPGREAPCCNEKETRGLFGIFDFFNSGVIARALINSRRAPAISAGGNPEGL